MSRMEAEKLRRPTLRLYLTQKLGLETGGDPVAFAESIENQAEEQGLLEEKPSPDMLLAKKLYNSLKGSAVEDFSLGPLALDTAPSSEVLGQLIKDFYDKQDCTFIPDDDLPGSYSFEVPSGGILLVTTGQSHIDEEIMIWVTVDFVRNPGP